MFTFYSLTMKIDNNNTRSSIILNPRYTCVMCYNDNMVIIRIIYYIGIYYKDFRTFFNMITFIDLSMLKIPFLFSVERLSVTNQLTRYTEKQQIQCYSILRDCVKHHIMILECVHKS